MTNVTQPVNVSIKAMNGYSNFTFEIEVDLEIDELKTDIVWGVIMLIGLLMIIGLVVVYVKQNKAKRD